MPINKLWQKAKSFLKNDSSSGSFSPDVDQQGLISEQGDSTSVANPDNSTSRLEIVRKPTVQIEKIDNIEVLTNVFNRMVEQLGGINEHLNMQIEQHHKLVDRIDQLPELLENLPDAVKDQKDLVGGLIEQLKGKALKDQQFIEAIEKIPDEAIKQSNVLVDMNRKLSVSADADVQMAESFNKFNETLSTLDADTVNQTDSIRQMNKTFAASDRYLKYILSKQQKRFMWVFITAISICGMAILSLVAIILIVMK
jgi:chromosome segregation ATPase